MVVSRYQAVTRGRGSQYQAVTQYQAITRGRGSRYQVITRGRGSQKC